MTPLHLSLSVLYVPPASVPYRFIRVFFPPPFFLPPMQIPPSLAPSLFCLLWAMYSRQSYLQTYFSNANAPNEQGPQGCEILSANPIPLITMNKMYNFSIMPRLHAPIADTVKFFDRSINIAKEMDTRLYLCTNYGTQKSHILRRLFSHGTQSVTSGEKKGGGVWHLAARLSDEFVEGREERRGEVSGAPQTRRSSHRQRRERKGRFMQCAVRAVHALQISMKKWKLRSFQDWLVSCKWSCIVCWNANIHLLLLCNLLSIDSALLKSNPCRNVLILLFFQTGTSTLFAITVFSAYKVH